MSSVAKCATMNEPSSSSSSSTPLRHALGKPEPNTDETSSPVADPARGVPIHAAVVDDEARVVDVAGLSEEDVKRRNVYVGQLPVEMNDAELRAIMETFGDIASLRVFRETRRAKRTGLTHALCLYREPTAASAAVKALLEIPIAGRLLEVNLSMNGVVKAPVERAPKRKPQRQQGQATPPGSKAVPIRVESHAHQTARDQQHLQQHSDADAYRTSLPASTAGGYHYQHRVPAVPAPVIALPAQVAPPGQLAPTSLLPQAPTPSTQYVWSSAAPLYPLAPQLPPGLHHHAILASPVAGMMATAAPSPTWSFHDHQPMPQPTAATGVVPMLAAAEAPVHPQQPLQPPVAQVNLQHQYTVQHHGALRSGHHSQQPDGIPQTAGASRSDTNNALHGHVTS